MKGSEKPAGPRWSTIILRLGINRQGRALEVAIEFHILIVGGMLGVPDLVFRRAGVTILNGGVDATRGHAGGARERNILRFVGSSLHGLPGSKSRKRAKPAQGKNEKKQRGETSRTAGVHFVVARGPGSSTWRI